MEPALGLKMVKKIKEQKPNRHRSIAKMRKAFRQTTPTKLTDLEAYWKGLRMPEMDKYTWGANKYCILCMKGNGEKILSCKQHWCAYYQERYTKDPKSQQPTEEEKEWKDISEGYKTP